MSKLLLANFSRLKKDKVFWIGMIAMFVFGVALVLSQYQQQVNYGREIMVNSVLFAYALPIGMVIAVFSSLFLGTEYSDGTIRNKIIVGHSRRCIYFSNLITNIVVGFLMCLPFFVCILSIGVPLLGISFAEPKLMALMLLGTMILIIAFCSIFTLLSMVCSNKTIVAVIAILAVVLFFLLAIGIYVKLESPEFVERYVYTDEIGNIVTEKEANPEYLTATQRKVYEFFYDFLPTGQARQYSDMTAKHLWQMPLYSLFITITTTAVGAYLFKRKDLK